MSLLQALILGIIQGLTEFIPISSTAHLILAGKILGQKLSPEESTAFNAVIQLGTVLAVLVYFAPDILAITKDFIGGNLAYLQKREPLHPNARLGWYIIIGSIPIVVAGLALKKVIEGVFTKDLYVIASSLLIWASLLLAAEFYGQRLRNVSEVNLIDAIVIGLTQTFALIPGSSRSGTTMTAALFRGLTRAAAARFSFLLSIPAVTGAGLFELYKSRHDLPSDLTAAMIASTITSAIVGYISIAFLMRYLQTHTTYLFIGYRVTLGVIILGLLFARVITR